MKHLMFEYNRELPLSEQLKTVADTYDRLGCKSLLFHVYSAFSDEEGLVSLCREIRSLYPSAVIAGTMSAGEIREGRLMPDGILISAMLFEESSVQAWRFDHIKGREVQVGLEVRQRIDSIDDLVGVELMFPGTSVHTQYMYAEISRCRPGVEIFGGYPGGHQLNSPEHYIFNEDGTMYDSLLLLAYAGKTLHINVDKTVGWEALGLPFKVTKADGNHLIELDGRPSAEVYEKFLQIDRKVHNNAEESFEFPLLARQNGDDRLRSTVHIEEDGSVYLHGFVTEGMDIHLSYGNPSNIVEKANVRLEALRRFQPQAILLYSCVVRKTFWEDFVDMEMIPFQKIAPAGGFHTWGEIMRVQDTGELAEHNITLLSIGMREGEAPEGELPEIRVDDSVLKGQASLLKRLTKLVYATMEELQKAHGQMEELNRRLTVMAETDYLTGLLNRGKTEQVISEALDETEKTNRPLSLIMVDVDHFKRINDSYGHHAGDCALMALGNELNACIGGRKGAAAGRWGGEEFFLILPDTDEKEALEIAERFRKDTEQQRIPAIGRMTVSLGVMTVSGRVDRREVFRRVDDALYAAKKNGRNQVQVSPPRAGETLP